VLDQMSLVAQRAGAACLVLGHQGKPQQDPKTGQERARKSYAIRGASAIEDAATNIFYMGKLGNENGYEMFSLVKRKYKGEAPDEYRLVRDPHTLTHTLLGNRPFNEVDRIATQAMITRVRNVVPDMKLGDVYNIIGAVVQKHPRTIQGYVEKN
jgi:hypothetical protein